MIINEVMPERGWAMRFQRRSAALRAEPVALSQAKPAAAIAMTADECRWYAHWGHI
jgi:hypothetical protein